MESILRLEALSLPITQAVPSTASSLTAAVAVLHWQYVSVTSLKVGSLPCSKCVWAINGRYISLPKWVMASFRNQAYLEVPLSSLRLSCLALRKSKKLSELEITTAPNIDSSTREERLDYVLNEWKCLHNCEPMEQREQKPNLFGLCRVVTEEDEVKYAANAMFLKVEAKNRYMPTI